MAAENHLWYEAQTRHARALLMTVYKDLKQPIGLRMEAAKAVLPYEKPRLARDLAL